MKHRKLGLAFYILGAIFLCLGAVGTIAYFGLKSSEELELPVLFICGIVGIVLGFAGLFTGWYFMAVPDKTIKKQIAKYAAYPQKEDVDYAKRIAKVREKFYADADPMKNRFEGFRLVGSAPCYDFSVIEKGKVYYAYLLHSFPRMYSNKRFPQVSDPATVIYSPDEYFDSDPLELKEIAKGLKDIQAHYFLGRDGIDFFTNMRLPDTLTGGREVYATTLIAYRMHLPLCCFSDALFPIVADPQKSTSAFIVDVKYWTKTMIGDYAHCAAHKAKKDMYDGLFD